MNKTFWVFLIIFIITFFITVIAGTIEVLPEDIFNEPSAKSVKPFIDFIEVIDIYDFWVMVISGIATILTWIAKKNSPF